MTVPELILFTLKMSGLAVLLVLPVVVLVAFYTSRCSGWFVELVNGLAILPLALPPVAMGIFLLKGLSSPYLLGGLIDGISLRVAFTWRAVVLALSVMSFPLMYLPARSGFQGVDRRLESLSRTLGRSRVSTFFRVTLPLAKRGIVSGVLLGWARAIGEFGCTVIVAGNIPGETRTLSLAIFHRFNMGDDLSAFGLAAITAGITLAIVILSGRFAREAWQP